MNKPGSSLAAGVLAGALMLAGCSAPEPPRPTVGAAPAETAAGPRKTEVGPFAQTARPAPIVEAADEVPLLPGLGTLSYPVTTSNPLAQRYFDQGLRLAYAFNHAEARRAFREAQALDPGCALCFWGEALVLGPNINAPMAPAALGPALEAVVEAQSLAGRAAPRERALIDALAARYSGAAGAERADLDRAYAEAMAGAARRFPEDDQIAVLYAEALMDLSPWDYWEAGGTRPKGRTAEIVRVLETVLRRNPDHPGAIHYYIHAVEASDRPQRAERYADRLAGLMPGAGHLVHMPAHIYYRVGRYRDAIATNHKAIAADEAYFERAGKRPGIYADAYYPHNVHFLMTSAQMAGDGATAVAAAEKLARLVPDESARAVPWVQPIKAAPYFAHAQFSPPPAILALDEPAAELPYVRAARHYARGIANAEAGDGAAAEREAAAIAGLRERADWSGLTAAGVPAGAVLEIAERVLRARLARTRGDWDAAEAELAAAVALQDRLPYMEPPFWYYPVQQSLGAVRLQAGDLAGAERAFRAALRHSPRSGWALYGLREVYRQRGDGRQLRDIERRLASAWLGDPDGPRPEQF
jgi:tetratricopeptide (TPR) repeat protein